MFWYSQREMKNGYIEKTIKRLQQKIKVLTSKPVFNQDILELRKKWHIPVVGIHSQEELDRWHQQLHSSTQTYFNSHWPTKRIELMKLQDAGKIVEYKEQLDLFNNAAPNTAFDRDIKHLIMTHKLSPRWHSAIKRYTLLNDPENMGIFTGIVLSTKHDLEFNMVTISLEIDADSTLDDIKAIWPEVKEMQSQLQYKQQNKFQPLKQFDRNKKAYELHQQGKKYREIADDFSQNGKIVGEEAIAKMIERHKKKADINQA